MLATFDVDFEGLAATKNTPPLPIMSSSFPSSLDIQQRFFVKCISHLESIMDPRRPDWPSVIRRDLSNLCVIAHLSHSVLFHRRS